MIAGGISDLVAKQSARVYRFDTALNLSPTLTSNVSDHYPVEFQLQSPAVGGASTLNHSLFVSLSLSVSVLCSLLAMKVSVDVFLSF